jgi:exopolysaccharide biosynthesis polyprenyl glycosylphosphotransferase
MFARRAKVLWILLIVSEMILVAFSFQLSYFARAIAPEFREFYLPSGTFLGLLTAAVCLWAATGLALGQYTRPETFGPMATAGHTTKQTIWFGLVILAAIYLMKLGDVSRLFVGLFIITNYILQMIYRLAAYRMRGFLRSGISQPQNFLIVGTGAKALEVLRSVEKNSETGDRVIGLVYEGEDAGAIAAPMRASDGTEYPLYGLKEIQRLLEEHIVDEILFAVAKQRMEKLEDLFLLCEEQGVRTRVLVDFFPHFRSEITLDRLDDLPLLTFSTTPANEYLLFVKRGFDLLLSAFLIVLLSPVFLVIALLIRLTSKGPAIFRQTRCGLAGRRFTFCKFRSMVLDAEQDRNFLEHLNEMDGPVFKIKDDPRVTTFGRFLRKTSLDELPQLFNIFKGDMSFVGPRPPLPEEVLRYEKWQRRRLRMKPGLTCLWILEGRNQLTFSRWMKLDMEYIDHWSLGLDFKIILRTIPRVLTGRGAS